MSDDLDKTEWIKFRIEPARKLAYEAAAAQAEIGLSEWLREAGDEKLDRDLNLTVGPTKAPRRLPAFQPAHEES